MDNIIETLADVKKAGELLRECLVSAVTECVPVLALPPHVAELTRLRLLLASNYEAMGVYYRDGDSLDILELHGEVSESCYGTLKETIDFHTPAPCTDTEGYYIILRTNPTTLQYCFYYITVD